MPGGGVGGSPYTQYHWDVTSMEGTQFRVTAFVSRSTPREDVRRAIEATLVPGTVMVNVRRHLLPLIIGLVFAGIVATQLIGQVGRYFGTNCPHSQNLKIGDR